MRNLLVIPIAALAMVLLEGSAWAQRGHSSVVTPSPFIHSGNRGQSAIHVGPQQVRTHPGSAINIQTRSRRGHRNRGYQNNVFFNNRQFNRHVHSNQCVFTPEYYTTQYRRVHVPARYEQRYIPPRYELRYRNGHQKKYLVAYGYNTRVYVEATYVSQPYQAHVPASWSCGFY